MEVYKRLFKYVPEKIHYVYLSSIFSVISAVLGVIPFWYLSKFLHTLLVESDLQQSTRYAVIIVGLLLLYMLMYFLALATSHFVAFRLERNLRKEAVNHLMKASFSFFDLESSGRIRKIIDDNASETHTIVAHIIPDAIVATLTPVLMVVFTFIVDIRLGIMFLIVLLISAFQLNGMMGNKAFMGEYMASLERMNSEAVEYVRGMQVVKIFRITIDSFKAFYNAIKSYAKKAYAYSKSCEIPYVSFEVLMNVFVIAAIPFGIMYISKGESSTEVLSKIVFFMCFSGTIFSAIMRIMYVSMFQFQAVQAVEKLENIFVQMQTNSLKRGVLNAFPDYSIEFKNVSFKYEEDYVLKDVSFKLEENKTYALVGSSGGGKSTIAKLISGFYKIDEGEIRIGGKNIEDYTENAMMKNISFVFQNTKLFKTSIFENVKLGNQNASDEQVMKALELAQCNDILEKFKDREHTVIGSKGVYLSGGETQRIAIARAILKDAKIVILDEASAATDPENEYEIQKAFTNLMKNKTVIMIAHRLSSIRNVDEILVVDNGDIVERGNDKELMAKNGRYKMLQDIFAKANDWRVYD